jgi:hypothetical protein
MRIQKPTGVEGCLCSKIGLERPAAEVISVLKMLWTIATVTGRIERVAWRKM